MRHKKILSRKGTLSQYPERAYIESDRTFEQIQQHEDGSAGILLFSNKIEIFGDDYGADSAPPSQPPQPPPQPPPTPPPCCTMNAAVAPCCDFIPSVPVLWVNGTTWFNTWFGGPLSTPPNIPGVGMVEPQTTCDGNGRVVFALMTPCYPPWIPVTWPNSTWNSGCDEGLPGAPTPQVIIEYNLVDDATGNFVVQQADPPIPILPANAPRLNFHTICGAKETPPFIWANAVSIAGGWPAPPLPNHGSITGTPASYTYTCHFLGGGIVSGMGLFPYCGLRAGSYTFTVTSTMCGPCAATGTPIVLNVTIPDNTPAGCTYVCSGASGVGHPQGTAWTCYDDGTGLGTSYAVCDAGCYPCGLLSTTASGFNQMPYAYKQSWMHWYWFEYNPLLTFTTGQWNFLIDLWNTESSTNPPWVNYPLVEFQQPFFGNPNATFGGGPAPPFVVPIMQPSGVMSPGDVPNLPIGWSIQNLTANLDYPNQATFCEYCSDWAHAGNVTGTGLWIGTPNTWGVDNQGNINTVAWATYLSSTGPTNYPAQSGLVWTDANQNPYHVNQAGALTYSTQQPYSQLLDAEAGCECCPKDAIGNYTSIGLDPGGYSHPIPPTGTWMGPSL